MGQRESLGEFEQLILWALLRLRDNAYGVTIHQEIEDRTKRKYSLGAIYTALDRLEKKGLVTSWNGEATAIRGGRAKRFFKIQAEGVSALKDSHETMSRMAHGLKPLLGGAQ